ncbi:MAG: hypothetical protein K2J80_09195 [Oscillospiraceae bacterium]|nr:hypothetical protein [Oscillospiraceae bacterium]
MTVNSYTFLDKDGNDLKETFTPPPVATTWTKKSAGSYSFTSIDKPADVAANVYGSADIVPEEESIPLSDLLPAGKTAADVRKITVTAGVGAWQSFDGAVGTNILNEDGTSDWADVKIKPEGEGGVAGTVTGELATPYGVDPEYTLKLQSYYMNYGTTVNVTITVECAEDEEPDEISIAVSPNKKSIAVNEEFDVTVEVTATGEFVGIEGTLTPEYDESVISVTYDKDNDVFKVKGLAAGSTNLTIGWVPKEESGITLENPLEATCEITVTEESGSDEVDTSGWKIAANGFTPSWGGWKSVEGTEGKLDFTCTIKDIMDANKISDIADFGGFIAQAWGVPLGDKVSYAVRIEAADGTVKANDTGTYTVVVNGGDGDNKDEPNYSLKQYAIAACNGDLVFAPTDVVKIVVASGTTIPTFPTKPDDGDDDDNNTAESTVLWEGNQTISWNEGDNVQIAPAKFADIKVGDTLKFTITCDANSQLKIAALTTGWPVLTGPNPDPKWGVVNVSGTSYSFVVNADDVAALKEFGMVVSGQNATVTKVELISKATPKPPVVDPTPDDPVHTHNPAQVWSSDATGHWHACSCNDKFEFAAHTSDEGTVTTPATETTAGTKTYKCTVCKYVIKTEPIPATGTSNTPEPVPETPSVPDHSYIGAPVIPTWIGSGTGSNAPSIIGDSGKSGWDAIGEEALAAPDGTRIEINMNGTTRVPSSIFKSIRNKDVDLVFDMGRGVKWTVNGLSVTKAKTIDFDFSKSARHIPDELVDAAEGSYKKQLSLDHNGSFGFAAVMTYDIGTKYNGSYANLFYYNRKTKGLELIYCSPISNGKASFVFNHASDYLITVTDEPLGDFEDVSAAAGISSDNSGVNAAAFAAVFAVITAAFGAVVYKKRRHN